MIPHLAKLGRSFRGSYLYLLHDVEARTSNRIAWTETLNMYTDCPHKAWKVMTYTAKVQNQLKSAAGLKNTGRKLEKPVMHLSLSWHPEETPDKDEMLRTAKLAIEKIGMDEHEAIVVAHNDTTHSHIHILLNRCHPETGAVAKDSHTKRKLSRFAQDYEVNRGQVYCERCIEQRNQPNSSAKGAFNHFAQEQEEQCLAAAEEFNFQIEKIYADYSLKLEHLEQATEELQQLIQKQGWLSRIFGRRARMQKRLKSLQSHFSDIKHSRDGKIKDLERLKSMTTQRTIRHDCAQRGHYLVDSSIDSPA